MFSKIPKIAFVVMALCSQNAISKTVGDLINTEPELSIFKQALEIAGLAQTVSQIKQVTLILPTNAVFDAIPSGELRSLLANPTKLRSVLLNHVIAVPVTIEKLIESPSFGRSRLFKTLSGLDIGAYGLYSGGTAQFQSARILLDCDKNGEVNQFLDANGVGIGRSNLKYDNGVIVHVFNSGSLLTCRSFGN